MSHCLVSVKSCVPNPDLSKYSMCLTLVRFLWLCVFVVVCLTVAVPLTVVSLCSCVSLSEYVSRTSRVNVVASHCTCVCFKSRLTL